MPTRLRVAMEVEGLRYRGRDVLKMLRKFHMTARVPISLRLRPTLEQIQWHFDHLAVVSPEMKKLWVFREPKRIKEKDSQYKQLLSDWGIRRRVPRTSEPTLRFSASPAIEWGGTWAEVPSVPNPPQANPTPQNRRQRTVQRRPTFDEVLMRYNESASSINFFGDQV